MRPRLAQQRVVGDSRSTGDSGRRAAATTPALSTVRLTPDHLPLCVPFWADRLLLSPHEFGEVMRRSAWLLQQGRAIGALVLAGDQPRAYGISSFVDERVADALVDSRQPQVGSRLLLTDDFASRVLDYDGVARRNASGQGLQLLVTSVQYRPELGFGDEVVGLMMKAFVDLHQGYRLSRMLVEVFGDPAITAVTANGSFVIAGRFRNAARWETLPSQLGIVTRERAMQGTVGLMPMFVYVPPLVRYTRAEQSLLTLALAGGTDEWLSGRLGIPLTAVKSRWLRIQQRTARRLPQLFQDVPVAGARGRGAQTRHIVLDYVRRTPSELTPYDERYEQ